MYFMTRSAPREDSEQPTHPHSLIRVFQVRLIDGQDQEDNKDSDQTAEIKADMFLSRVHS